MLHFKVDPTIADEILMCVFVNEFFRDVGDLDADVFRLVQRCVEIEVFEIKGGKASIGLGEYTVDEEFGRF